MKTPKHFIKILVLFTFLVLIFSGCEKTELGEDIYLHIGEKQKITSNLSFSIDSLWDSRCPTGMECLWEGDVDLFFHITHSHEQIDTLFSCYPSPDVSPFKIAGYNWKVLEVNPYPDFSHSLDQKNIIIKMVITKE
jgi:hypothetical protein